MMGVLGSALEVRCGAARRRALSLRPRDRNGTGIRDVLKY